MGEVTAIAILVIVLAVGYIFYRSSPGKTRAHRPSESVTGSVRLSHLQLAALSAASVDKPIYGENPSFRYAQMPDDCACFSLRTITSLEQRGYLKPDGKGGYLLTPEGANALQKRAY